MLLMEHLPECALSDNTNWPSWEVDCCICDRLRACEQRMLDAAREAVAGLPEVAGWTGELAIIRKPIALAAIDALKEKP